MDDTDYSGMENESLMKSLCGIAKEIDTPSKMQSSITQDMDTIDLDQSVR